MLVFYIRCIMKLKRKVKIIGGIIIILLLLVCFFFIFRSTKDELEGLWDIDGNTKYEFDGQGRGKLIVPMNEYKFTYTIKNNILSIDFANENSEDTDYEYMILNDELKITSKDYDKNQYILKKVEKN